MFAVGSGSRHVHYAYIYDVCVCVSIFTLCALSRVCMMWSKCMIVSVRFIYFIFLLDANGVRYINSKRSGVQLHSTCVFITHITPFYCVFLFVFLLAACSLPAAWYALCGDPSNAEILRRNCLLRLLVALLLCRRTHFILLSSTFHKTISISNTLTVVVGIVGSATVWPVRVTCVCVRANSLAAHFTFMCSALMLTHTHTV